MCYGRAKDEFNVSRVTKHSSLDERVLERNEGIFDVKQIRNKFKKCSTCKKACLTIRTASGITNFRQNKDLGRWFEVLYPFIKSRDSCQPERGAEPSHGGDAADAEFPADDDEEQRPQETFVPRNSSKRTKNDLLAEVIKSVNTLVEKDDSKEIVDLIREENEKNRKHQMEMLKLENEQFKETMRMLLGTHPTPTTSAQPQPQLHPSNMMFFDTRYHQGYR